MTQDKLESDREQYDNGENMTLNAAPNRTQVCKALGVPRETGHFSPTNKRQRSWYIFFFQRTHSMLWDILHNKWTEPIDHPTKELVNLLEQTEHNKRVLSPRVNEKKTRTNLVVIDEAATYFNITKKN